MLRTVRNFVLSGTLAALAISLVAVGGNSAAAEDVATVSTPMHEATAIRVVGAPGTDGTVPVLLTDGTTVSIPQNQVNLALRANQNAVQPANVVRGNCGTSKIFLHEKSNGRPVRMTTGFTINSNRPGAVFYSWDARIQGPRGSGYGYNYHASGGLRNRHSWNGQHTSDGNYARGIYATAVTAGGALLANGVVCLSGFPADIKLL